jgi:hypothetical protein
VDYLKSHSLVPVLAAKSALHKLASLKKSH